MNRRAVVLAALAAALPAAAEQIEATEYRRMADEIERLTRLAPTLVQWAVIRILEAPWRPYTLVSTPEGTVMQPTQDMRNVLLFLLTFTQTCKVSSWT